MRIRRIALLTSMFLVAALLLVLAVTPRAEAIPAFSRKYATSCATCHVAYPKLNAFGEAFRYNGYRMPGGDEQFEKDEPISLGAEPWKRLWPSAIWPSDIPYLPPVSVLVDNEYSVEPDAPINNDFRFPANTALLVGGTFGESLSFFGRINLTAPGEDLHVHRLFGQFDKLFGTNLLNVRFGQLEPRAVAFSSNRRLTRPDYLVNTQTFPLEELLEVVQALEEEHHDELVAAAAGMPASADEEHDEGGHDAAEAGGHQHGGDFAIGTTQQGVEVWGVANGFGGRGGVEYGFGVVNGNGSGDFADTGANDNNSSKDVYGRLSYKFGGMSVLGSAESAPAQTDNWRDDSLRVGFSGYRGSAPFAIEDPGHGAHGGGFLHGLSHAIERLGVHAEDAEERFTRLGVDFDWRFQDLNLFGGYVWGETRLDPLARPDLEESFNSWFTQADYVLFPWLVGALRYENVDLPDAFRGDLERWVPHVTALIRANVKFTFDATLYPNDERNDRYLFTFDFVF